MNVGPIIPKKIILVVLEMHYKNILLTSMCHWYDGTVSDEDMFGIVTEE